MPTRTWSLAVVEECQALLCPNSPPKKPEGGYSWFEYDRNKYKCPGGYMFEGGHYPYWWANCTVQKVWNPLKTIPCVRKSSVQIICRHLFPALQSFQLEKNIRFQSYQVSYSSIIRVARKAS